jgi:hypothetical protein
MARGKAFARRILGSRRNSRSRRRVRRNEDDYTLRQQVKLTAIREKISTDLSDIFFVRYGARRRAATSRKSIFSKIFVCFLIKIKAFFSK